MRIGILSYPLNNNYGCYLQAYALVTVLKRMGHDVVYIHRRHNKPGLKFRVKHFVRVLFHDIIHFETANPIYNYEWEYMLKKGSKMIPFFEKHIPHTPAYYTSKDLRKHCQNYDAIIVGSDQVWRAELLHDIKDYFLGFLDNPKTLRIAYAASFGKKEAGYTNDTIKNCGELISKFKAVSLREYQGIEMISNFGWNCPKPQIVLDPTLLLNKEDYQKLISINKNIESLFCYILDQSVMTDKVIKQVSKQLKLYPYNILKGMDEPDYQYESIETWLNCFNSTTFVITDSFHGMVFSIIFEVPFIVVQNTSRGIDRIISLLQSLGLEDRLISCPEDSLLLMDSKIDWPNVRKRIREMKDDSFSFLYFSLS